MKRLLYLLFAFFNFVVQQKRRDYKSRLDLQRGVSMGKTGWK